MALKADDRKALNQIKKILAGLEGESYVKQAMDGMIEDAESNIENDFWNSWRMRAEYIERDFNRAEDEIAELKEQNRKLTAEMELTKKTLQDERERANSLASKCDELRASYREAVDKSGDKEVRVQELELEIIKLKAKLYDMMVGA